MLYVYLCTDIITLDILYPIVRHVICLLVYRLHNFGHISFLRHVICLLCTDITLDILYPILRHVICLLVYRHHNFGHFISYFKTCYMSTCVQTS